jgi:hypothetical protein
MSIARAAEMVQHVDWLIEKHGLDVRWLPPRGQAIGAEDYIRDPIGTRACAAAAERVPPMTAVILISVVFVAALAAVVLLGLSAARW